MPYSIASCALNADGFGRGVYTTLLFDLAFLPGLDSPTVTFPWIMRRPLHLDEVHIDTQIMPSTVMPSTLCRPVEWKMI